eukprot:CAMPEP_0167788272 /NCGR_PEP_ID=MMETSP0111_2-20121227/9941_1 /TAXON_ID=91324 /ORGANISM="Lotharella globosa, Strain CCCM811" /LENGTH=119 /DNA_ID=CAMNT_0007680117 /DNA_START=388 /DNA_END=744 /DNA_ORIENTATION=-
MRELKALSTVGTHPNIIRFIGMVTSAAKIGFLIEYCSAGSLDRLHHLAMWRCQTFFRIARDVCSGLVYLDERRIVHRDIACRNLLMKGNGTVVIADFGLAQKLDHPMTRYKRTTKKKAT